MISEPEDYLSATQQLNGSLPPPLFDDIAAAMAQPVEPLPSNRFGRWSKRVKAKRIFTRRVLALVIVIASGIVAGAAGGAMLVKRETANEATFAEQTTSAPANAESTPDETAFQATTMAAEAGATQSRRRPRVRRNRGRVWISSAQSSTRAYKVATIR